jgi:hypothetical protein
LTRKGTVVTTILDLAGTALVIAAAFVVLGLGAALAAAGVACLLASWSLTATARARGGERL